VVPGGSRQAAEASGGGGMQGILVLSCFRLFSFLNWVGQTLFCYPVTSTVALVNARASFIVGLKCLRNIIFLLI
jgi:hypothetical protein